MKAGRDLGETLIEILLTVVITGLTVTALLSSLATAGNAGNVQQNSVQTDIVMRNLAESTKLAVQQQCTAGATAYTVAVPGVPDGFGFQPPTGNCPAVGSAEVRTLVVTAPLGLSTSMDIRVNLPPTVAAPLTISSPAALPAGQVGVAYPVTTVTSSSGTGTKVWSAATGLPAGLAFNTANQQISGTPTASGTFNAVVTVTDALSATATQTYTFTITAQLTVTGPATLPNGQVGVAYPVRTMTSAGGTSPLTWSATALPAGVTINPATGVISGSPTASGTFNPVVTVTDALSATATQTYAVAIAENTPPVNSLTISVVSGNAFKSGNTIYYRGSAAGSFRLTNAVTDSGSGPASSATAALTGTPTGWSHVPSTVSTPSGGPFVSTVFSWAASTTSAPFEVVTGRDVDGNGVATTLSFVNDSIAPGTGSVDYANGYQPSRSVAVTFTTGADSGSGIATRQLQRSSAPLPDTGICGTFSSFVDVGPALPTSPYTDLTVSNSNCFRYRYVVTDQVGNQRITTSGNVARVDYHGFVDATAGLLSYWRLGEASPSTTINDSTGTNNGTYSNSPTRGVGGAIPGDSNTAVQFDGVNEYGSVARQVADDFSIEFWFKSTQGIGTGTQWWSGAGLVDAEVGGAQNDFGVSLRSDGRVVAGVGTPDVSIVSTTGGLNNGAWHHVVFTRTRSTRALRLYIDGVAAGSATGSTTNFLTAAANINFGRIQTGGNYFAGSLDEVAVYNTVLAPATVTAHFNLGQP